MRCGPETLQGGAEKSGCQCDSGSIGRWRGAGSRMGWMGLEVGITGPTPGGRPRARPSLQGFPLKNDSDSLATPLFGCFHSNPGPGKMPKYYYNHPESKLPVPVSLSVCVISIGCVRDVWASKGTLCDGLPTCMWVQMNLHVHAQRETTHGG